MPFPHPEHKVNMIPEPLGWVIRWPGALEMVWTTVHLLIALLMLLGLGASIADGEVRNHPEVLRWIFFVAFSLAMCLRVCFVLGFRANTPTRQCIFFVVAYMPIGSLSAYLIGLLPLSL